MTNTRGLYILGLSIAGLVFFERELHAYADPGSGALLWQMVVGAFFGAMYLIRKFFAHITRRNSVRPK